MQPNSPKKPQYEGMRSIFIIIFFTVLFGTTTAVTAQKPIKFIIPVAKEKCPPGTSLKVKFASVVEDSRCPEGVNCIWAGVAKIKIKLRRNGKSGGFELNTNQLDKAVSFEGYEIKLVALTPYPKNGSAIRPAAYSATLTVTKLKTKPS